MRRDPASGVVEEVGFFGSHGDQLFGATHLPAGTPRGALVICSPLMYEQLKNYRTEVVLSRALAEYGFAVQRFHYRGAGNSDGECLTFESMVEDALAASERIRVRGGVSRLGFVGTRVGALVAAAAAVAAEQAGAPLVLWDPVVDGAAFFQDVFRARMVAQLRAGAVTTPPSTQNLVEQLVQNGDVEVLGFPVERSLYQSLRERTMEAVLGDRSRPILLVQMSRSATLRGPYARVKRHLESHGFALDTQVVEQEVGWWFQGMQESEAAGRPVVISLTQNWLAGQFAERASV